MMTTFKTTLGWTKIFIAFVFLFSLFGRSLTAQTDFDKPLEAKRRAGLLTELKEVVAKSGTTEKDAALVAQMWDKRTDLAGKTKKEVISLLYQDVKAVITDSGIQYQIYSIFSAYKQIPDESLSAETPKSNAASMKAASVKKLIDLTLPAHPSVSSYTQTNMPPTDKRAKEAEAKVKQMQREKFDNALKGNNELTTEKKLFVKVNYKKLGKIVDKQILDGANADFPVEQWIKESLEQSYTAKFTDAELIGLIAFLQGTKGQQILKYYKNAMLSDMSVEGGGAPLYTKADKAETDKFTKTPIGEKFSAAFITDSNTFTTAKLKEVNKNGKTKNDAFSILDPANLNKIFNEFVKDNYKK